VLAIAGSLAPRRRAPPPRPAPSRPRPLFVGLLVGVILIVGGLTFFPALALGPIVEHFAMLAGQTF
jgi:K+-transporting ATPase ATPase A chain